MRTCAGLPLALAFVALVGAQSPAARLARRADPTTCYTSVASSTAGAPATTSTSSPGCAASFVCGATTTSTVSSAGADNTETTTVEVRSAAAAGGLIWLGLTETRRSSRPATPSVAALSAEPALFSVAVRRPCRPRSGMRADSHAGSADARCSPSGLTSCQMDGMSDGATECVGASARLLCRWV